MNLFFSIFENKSIDECGLDHLRLTRVEDDDNVCILLCLDDVGMVW